MPGVRADLVARAATPAMPGPTLPYLPHLLATPKKQKMGSVSIIAGTTRVFGEEDNHAANTLHLLDESKGAK